MLHGLSPRVICSHTIPTSLNPLAGALNPAPYHKSTSPATQVCGHGDSNPLKNYWLAVTSMAALCFDDAMQHQTEFVKECGSALQAAFLLKSAGKKLMALGSSASARCKKDTNEAIMKVVVHQRNALRKALQKMSQIRNMFDQDDAGYVLTFDASDAQAFLKDVTHTECVLHLAEEFKSSLTQFAEHAAAIVKGVTSWRADVQNADWQTVRPCGRRDHSALGRLTASEAMQPFPAGHSFTLCLDARETELVY